jgi:hypothetical protein
MLMDRIILLDHQKHWGREPSPTAAVLDRLGPAESALYADLIAGTYAPVCSPGTEAGQLLRYRESSRRRLTGSPDEPE